MPLYQYKCSDCGKEFEELRRMNESDADIECPECSNKNIKRKMPTSVCKNSSGGSHSHSNSCG